MVIEKPASIKRPGIFLVTLWQGIFSLVVVAILWQGNQQWAISYGFGSIIHIIPSAYFGFQSFRYMGASKVKYIKNSMNTGFLGKFVLTVLMFAITFQYVRAVNLAALLAAYIANTLLHLVLTIIMLKKSENN